MKRASYREGVQWIAQNDECGEMSAEVMAGMVSVNLLADLFGKEPAEVAAAVIRTRQKEAKEADKRDRLSAEMEQDFIAQNE